MTETQPQTAVSVWQIDPAHSAAEFAVKHMMISTVKGHFGPVTGELRVDRSNPANASIEANIDITTIETGVADRNNHLKSPDFFDVANYPTITFKSTKIETTGEDKHRMTGDLTMHGVTKEVALDVEFEGVINDPFGNERAGFSATTTLNRKDFGLGWNMALEAGGVVVSEKVKVEIHIEATKQIAQA